jgi:hypothetical protein
VSPVTGLSDQNRALVEAARTGYSGPNGAGWWHVHEERFNRLLDAARTEGRRSGLIDSGRACGAFLSDEVSGEFVEVVPEEIRLKIRRLSRDAARYRYLRDGPHYELTESGEDLDEFVDGEIIRAAVQAATGAGDVPAPPPFWQRPSVATPAQGMMEGKITYPEGWAR